MNRPISIRSSLMLGLVPAVLVMGLAIFIVVSIGARRAVRDLSSQLIRLTHDQMLGDLDGFFSPAERMVELTAGWAEEGLLTADDPALLTDLMRPYLRAFPQISTALVADDRGREVMLVREADGWRRRHMQRDTWADEVRWSEWAHDADPPDETRRETTAYDPRQRPWYLNAMAGLAGDERASVRWTDPYRFFDSGDPGITVSTAVRRDDRTIVVGFDILLNDLSDFVSELRASRNSLVFMGTGDRRLLGIPADARFGSAEERRALLLEDAATLQAPIVNDARRVIPTDARLAAPVRFRSDDGFWWGNASRFDLDEGNWLWIVALVPETDLLGGLSGVRWGIAIITLFVLGLAITVILILAGRYSRPIEMLVAESDRISQGDLDSSKPIPTRVAEVLHLTAAHDRMRTGLRQLLKLERDIQVARQIQQSTFPDDLPTVPGFELAAWNEPADETGGDTYDVIGCGQSGKDGFNHVVMLLADATGHGIGPALSVTQLRAMLRIALRLQRDVGRIAGNVNEQLFADLPGDRFITGWFGDLDARDATLHSFSAGQAPLLHYVAADDRAHVLEADTVPLGIMPDLEMETAPRLKLAPGDMFVVLSDGIYEAADPNGTLFGTNRVVDLIRRGYRDTPEALVTAIRAAVEDYTQGAPPNDDRTGIIIKRTG